MEYTGYILGFQDKKCFYCESGITDDPFEALFFFDKGKATNLKNEIEDEYQNNFYIIKVKKTIHVID
jgi:hypothetical protein